MTKVTSSTVLVLFEHSECRYINAECTIMSHQQLLDGEKIIKVIIIKGKVWFITLADERGVCR